MESVTKGDRVGNLGSGAEVKSLVWLECSSPGVVYDDAQCVVPALHVMSNVLGWWRELKVSCLSTIQ